MAIINSYYAFQKATDAAVKESGNTQGETLIIQVTSTASAFKLKFYGKVDFEAEDMYPINAVNLSSFDVLSEIKESGLYTISIDGLALTKAELSDVEGGEVTVFCRVKGG